MSKRRYRVVVELESLDDDGRRPTTGDAIDYIDRVLEFSSRKGPWPLCISGYKIISGERL